MKRIFLMLFCLLLFAGLSFAQNNNPLPTNGAAAQPQPATPQGQQIPDSSAQPQSQPQSPAATQPNAGPAGATANPGNHTAKIAPGSVIPVQLTKTIDAKKAKTGDEVVAKVTQDMKTNSGDVLVPKDTKIIGHVTEAQPHSKEQKESQMAIAFDHAVMKDGDQVNLPMSIQAIIGTQQNNAANAGGTDQGGPAPSSAGGGQPAVGAGAARPGMNAGGSTPSPSASPTAGDNTAAASTGTANGGMPPITGQTTGVIGIPHMSLQSGANGNQGSVITSDKNNVKLENGTLMLLKVNQQ